jgi:hypothetical protein
MLVNNKKDFTMRSFREYLAESEYAAENPVPGDHFDIELGVMDVVIETTVVEINEDGSVIVECDDRAIQLLKEYNALVDVDQVNEAEYQGRKVPLGKPMKGDVKKSKVYVKNAKGNVVKVNFGDKTMKIKKSNPGRRKSFRARHNCANPGPRWKARYWSCRAW